MVKSARGKDIDIQAMRIKHAKQRAVGNANVNARGDLIDKQGKVIKTREQLAQEYNRKNTNAVKNVPVSQDVSKAMQADAAKIAAGNAEHAKSKKKTKTEE